MIFYKIMIMSALLFMQFLCFAKNSEPLIPCFKSDSVHEVKDKLDRMNYTKYSRMLFKAYMRQDGHNRSEIDDILKKCNKSKLYHLDRAFRYGIKKLSKVTNLHKRVLVERAVWNISQDFADENAPTRWMETLFWASISTGSFLVGSYAQRRYGSWDIFSNWVTDLFARGQVD